MSEARPVYIPCASGNQLMTDLMIRRCGDLDEIAGHPIMHMIATGRSLRRWHHPGYGKPYYFRRNV
jgi:hypothetical protein